MKVTIDSSEPLADALRVIGAVYNVSLRPPEVVVRMACDQGFFFALDYRKGVEIW